MSFFYLSPVKGILQTHLLETIVFKRVEFLTFLLKKESLQYNEFVIEGSVYDNVGHFLLTIIVILSNDKTMTKFFVKTENELFLRRLLTLSAYDLRLFAKKLLRTLKKYDTVPEFLEPLQVLCQQLLLKHKAQHIGHADHGNSCSMFSISLRFKHCLQLVAKRQVEIKGGKVLLPCGLWKRYLAMLFSINLQMRLANVDLEPLRNDPRIMELVTKLKKEKSIIPLNSNKNVLKSQEVDALSQKFPPCMLNLHQSLRSKHRLSHDQRFYYSLFLKDIGMPVEEAIEFWRKEYQQAPGGHHPCCHNWEKDEKKYLYGIRHMYGLEGARKSYTSVSCSRIQCTTNTGSEGGCPFKSFDTAKMENLLGPNIETVLPQINEFKRRRMYTKACVLYMQKKLENNLEDCDRTSFNFTPVQYYSMFSELKPFSN